MPPVWKRVSPCASEQVGGFQATGPAAALGDGKLPAWLDQVEMEPLFARRWSVTGAWKLAPRVLLVDWMMWIERGTVRFEIDGISEPLSCEPGSLVVIPSGVMHAAVCVDSQPAGLITAHFKAQLFGNLGCLNLLGITGAYRTADAAPVSDAMVELCRETLLDSIGRRRLMRGQLERILIYVLRNHQRSLKPQAPSGQYQYLERLQPILGLIEESMDKSNLSVPELAAAGAVSEVYLRRMFRQTLGISPAAYMQRRRAQHAGHLLRTSQLSVKEISRLCGFRDPHFMMRVFRKWMRQTPTEFRQAREL